MKDKNINCANPATETVPPTIEVKTQLTPDDLENQVQINNGNYEVSEQEIEESVVEINPDINSMESRG